jgi:DNA-binding response OmpR family regulator
MSTPEVKILAVDDDERLLRLVKHVLTGNGYEVITVVDPMRAIEIARDQRPSVVLSDMVMPDMDGYQLTAAIIAQGALTQVILMTGFAEPIKIIDGYRAGASDYIIKPFNVEELVAVVEAAVQRYLRWRRLVGSSLRGGAD